MSNRFYNVLSECWTEKLNVNKRAVMTSYLDLANDAYIANANFHYQNVVWLNYYRNLVNGILDNKALYAYKTLEIIVNSPGY